MAGRLRELDALGWARAGASKKEWGNIYWGKLQARARRWAARPSPSQVLAEHRFLQSVFRRLPCAECRTHALAYYWDYYPQLEGGRVAYTRWLFDFHNHVNKRLGKPHYPWATYVQNHWEEMQRCGHL